MSVAGGGAGVVGAENRMSDARITELTTQFHSITVNDTRFEILKRYDSLRFFGSGAQGIVW